MKEGEGMVMTKEDITRKLAEAYYLRRCQEGIEGDAQIDWYFAECAVRFFEKPPRYGEWWWEKDKEDFEFFAPLYDVLTNSKIENKR